MSSSKKAALGRGLNALLPTEQEVSAPEEQAGGELGKSRLYHFEDRVRLAGRVADLEVDHIRPNPYQPRKDFDEKALDELAASILQLGIIQPLTVRALGIEAPKENFGTTHAMRGLDGRFGLRHTVSSCLRHGFSGGILLGFHMVG